MTHSMTAFARVQSQLGGSLLCWELKSVNHRYLDVSFRLPESFRALETNLRGLLRGQIHRGKLECQLKVNDMVGENKSMLINHGLVKALLEASATLVSDHQVADDLTVSHILAWPGVVDVMQADVDALSLEIGQSFQDALTQLIAARLAEGTMLKEHVKSRVLLLNNEISGAKLQVELISAQTREKLLMRLQQLQIEVTDTRIEQEIAVMLARLDVSEELDRLQTHLNEVARTLDCDDVAGRRLDFLMQELNREANTLSSKSDSVVLTQHAVQMKVLIEQMREQIQNIE
jgi:uncharacterized protein (TIGR00255 family)